MRFQIMPVTLGFNSVENVWVTKGGAPAWVRPGRSWYSMSGKVFERELRKLFTPSSHTTTFAS